MALIRLVDALASVIAFSRRGCRIVTTAMGAIKQLFFAQAKAVFRYGRTNHMAGAYCCLRVTAYSIVIGERHGQAAWIHNYAPAPICMANTIFIRHLYDQNINERGIAITSGYFLHARMPDHLYDAQHKQALNLATATH